jgi:hypothetical protein
MSTDRLMATAFRFEINKGNTNSKRHAQDLKIAVRIFLNLTKFNFYFIQILLNFFKKAYENEMRELSELQK